MIPGWVDRREYPFTPRALDVDGGRLSYLDEGSGPVVLMVHGTPTWSFLYRHLVKGLSGHCRCVAPVYVLSLPRSTRSVHCRLLWMASK